MASRRRLLIDGRALLDPSSGGVFEYATRLTEALRRSPAFETSAWANRHGGGPATGVDRLTRLPNKLLHASLLALGRPRLDRLAGGPRPDLFWAPNPHFISVSAGVRFALTIHDLSFERFPEFFSSRQRLWHAAVRPRALARRSDVILAVSEQTKRDVIELYGLPEKKVVVTHEGCDARFFEPLASGRLDETRRRYNLPERFILHLGALEPRKNHRSLIEAFELIAARPGFRDLALVLAGPPGWNNADILHAIEESPYRERVFRLGFVPPEDKRALYRLASVFAFPSYYEGFGLPPLEAMASGTPVVASFAGSLGEIVGDAGILIDPYRPGELADAISAVLEEPALAARLSAAGRRRAEPFSWEACAKKTESALSGALD